MKEGIVIASAMVAERELHYAVDVGIIRELTDENIRRTMADTLMEGGFPITETKDYARSATRFEMRFAAMSPERYRELCRAESRLASLEGRCVDAVRGCFS